MCGAKSATEYRTYGTALGHLYTDNITTYPTCTEPGVRTYTCTRCPHSYTETIEPTKHHYKEGYSYNSDEHWIECYEGDDRKEVGVHSFTNMTEVPATCTEGGSKTYSCICGYSYTVPTNPLGHDITPGVYQHDQSGHWQECARENCNYKTAVTSHNYHESLTEGNCVTHSVLHHECDCGEQYDEEGEYGEHDFIETITTPAAYSSCGEKEITCSHCDYHKTEMIKHTGPCSVGSKTTSPYVSINDSLHGRLCCNGCGATVSGFSGYHVFADFITKEPNGDEPGEQISKCVYCNYVKESGTIAITGTRLSDFALSISDHHLPTKVGDTITATIVNAISGYSFYAYNFNGNESTNIRFSLANTSITSDYVLTEEDIGKQLRFSLYLYASNGYYIPLDEDGVCTLEGTLEGFTLNKPESNLSVMTSNGHRMWYYYFDYTITAD